MGFFLILIYGLAPLILFGCLVLGALAAAIVVPRTMYFTIPALLACIGWCYVELNAAHWQMDKLCETKAGQFIYERVYGVSIIHDSGYEDCAVCYLAFDEQGYAAVEFTVNSNWRKSSVDFFGVEIGKHYRASIQPNSNPNCRHGYARYFESMRRKYPGMCLAVEPIREITAPISMIETRVRENRLLGEIETWRKAYVRRSDGKLLAEDMSFRWWSRGPLANHFRGLGGLSGSPSVGEFSCHERPLSHHESINKYISPSPRP